MREVTTYKLAQIASIKSGKRLPAGHDFSSEQTAFPYVRARDIKNGRILSDGLAYISAETHDKIKRYIIQKGDVAITIVANIGDVGYCFQDCHNANLTENAVRLTNFDESKVDSKYLAYYLGQSRMKQYMESLAVGAAQAKLGIYKIEKIKVSLPPLPTQRRIASILSTYDSLIENNTRRIRLLEQMAGNLYKEWFVRFRFPGHETCKMVDGIPEGWRVERLEGVLEIRYGKDHKHIDDGNIPILGSGGVMRYGNKSLYTGESVLIPRKGTLNNIMYRDDSFWTVDTMFYTIPKEEHVCKYLYYVLSGINMESMNPGAALPSMTTNILNRLKIILPHKAILEKFDKIMSSHYCEIKNLQSQNASLARQRDLLLPRLMSGKIEV